MKARIRRLLAAVRFEEARRAAAYSDWPPNRRHALSAADVERVLYPNASRRRYP